MLAAVGIVAVSAKVAAKSHPSSVFPLAGSGVNAPINREVYPTDIAATFFVAALVFASFVVFTLFIPEDNEPTVLIVEGYTPISNSNVFNGADGVAKVWGGRVDLNTEGRNVRL
jgi:hypothetical protein